MIVFEGLYKSNFPFILFTSVTVVTCLAVGLRIRKRLAEKDVERSELDQMDEKNSFIAAKQRFERTVGVSPELAHVDEFEHQVAGHTKEVLAKFNDKILKPRIKLDLFLREVSLYEEFADSVHSATLTPYPFLPKYFGGCSYSASAGCPPIDYLVLEDLTRSFSRPCAMDIKIGKQTFEPNAKQDKKARELKKYVFQEEVGFRITGFKTYNAITATYREVDKTYGRSLHPSEVESALGSFFINGGAIRSDVISAVVVKLEKMLRWFKSQNMYHFYCSSILIVYDGVKVPAMSIDELVEVKMIDLAHTLRCEAGSPLDVGYIHGLGNLITNLRKLLVDVPNISHHNN